MFAIADLAYIAGFFDGEGNVGVYKSTRAKYAPIYAMTVRIANTDLQTLEYIRGLLGGTLTEKIANRKAGHRPLYSLDWYGSNALNVLRLILPYVKTKRKQVELAIYYQEFVVLPHGGTDSPMKKELRESIYQMSKKLKQPVECKGGITCKTIEHLGFSSEMFLSQMATQSKKGETNQCRPKSEESIASALTREI